MRLTCRSPIFAAMYIFAASAIASPGSALAQWDPTNCDPPSVTDIPDGTQTEYTCYAYWFDGWNTMAQSTTYTTKDVTSQIDSGTSVIDSHTIETSMFTATRRNGVNVDNTTTGTITVDKTIKNPDKELIISDFEQYGSSKTGTDVMTVFGAESYLADGTFVRAQYENTRRVAGQTSYQEIRENAGDPLVHVLLMGNFGSERYDYCGDEDYLPPDRVCIDGVIRRASSLETCTDISCSEDPSSEDPSNTDAGAPVIQSDDQSNTDASTDDSQPDDQLNPDTSNDDFLSVDQSSFDDPGYAW